jgi:hypothetical protein
VPKLGGGGASGGADGGCADDGGVDEGGADEGGADEGGADEGNAALDACPLPSDEELLPSDGPVSASSLGVSTGGRSDGSRLP